MSSDGLEDTSRFSLFVYGSLRTGGEHHDVVAPHLVEVQKASLRGTLHQRQDHYWTVRDVTAIWTGGENQHEDIVRLSSTMAIERTDHEFDLYDEPMIEGEVLHLNGGAALLKKLDEFEGFRGEPGDVENDYLRVAVTLAMGAHSNACFCYVDARPDANGPEGKVAKFL